MRPERRSARTSSASSGAAGDAALRPRRCSRTNGETEQEQRASPISGSFSGELAGRLRRVRVLAAIADAALVALVAGRGARGVAARLRARRRDRRRRVERDPAVAREVGLDPRVRVEVAHDVLLARVVVRAGREAGGHARRHAAHPQQQRHRTAELLAVADAIAEQERVERDLGERRRLGVARVAPHLALDAPHEVIRRGRGGREPLGERVLARVGRGAQRAASRAWSPRWSGSVRGPARARRTSGT